MTELLNSISIAGSGMRAQSERMKVISQNIANVDSTGQAPGAAPYRRKTIVFKNQLDREMGIEKVNVKKVSTDKSEFRKEYNPTHPAADANGYVLLPNVDIMIEMVDMKEAERSYEANLNVIDATKQMLFATIGLLK